MANAHVPYVHRLADLVVQWSADYRSPTDSKTNFQYWGLCVNWVGWDGIIWGRGIRRHLYAATKVLDCRAQHVQMRVHRGHTCTGVYDINLLHLLQLISKCVLQNALYNEADFAAASSTAAFKLLFQ
jgi:hypothetical protein